MGLKGTDGLRRIARGFRVEVLYVDENVTPKIAKSVNVQFAHAEGLVMDPTLEDFALGWMWRVRTMVYSGVAGHEFGWWSYGMDSSRSADRQAFIDVVHAAREAHLWVFAWAGLTWDAANLRWVVENLVIAPMKLHDFTRITEGYQASTQSMVVSTYNCWDESTPENMTIKLDTTGDLQTLVGLFVWRADTNLATFTVPVLPAQWETRAGPDREQGQDLGPPGQGGRRDLHVARLQRARLQVHPRSRIRELTGPIERPAAAGPRPRPLSFLKGSNLYFL